MYIKDRSEIKPIIYAKIRRAYFPVNFYAQEGAATFPTFHGSNKHKEIILKGTVRVISSDHSCKDGNGQFTMVSLH